MEREEKARSEEAAEHATSAAALQQNIADLQVQIALHDPADFVLYLTCSLLILLVCTPYSKVCLQARLREQEAATAEQSACAQQLQEAVETGKGKLAESAAFMLKLQDEQNRAKEQIAEYAAQVVHHTLHASTLPSRQAHGAQVV